MSTSKRHSPRLQSDRIVRIGKSEYPVIDRITIRRHTYLVLQKMGGSDRHRYMVFDPDARGELRSILVLPYSAAAEQHARVLKRLPLVNVNLPRILNFDRADDELRLVLTWVDGPTLKEFLQHDRQRHDRQISAYESLRLIRGLAHGLLSLHKHSQLIHADLTPSNIIVASKTTQLVTIDFGSGWLMEQTSTRAASDGVTPVYAAPELQFGGTGINFRCDQFSASVILYQMLTGKIPYANLGGKAGRPEYGDRVGNEYFPPSHLSPDRRRMPRSVWSGIDRVVKTGLALDPDERYPTTGAWVDDLEAVYLEMRYLARSQASDDKITTRVVDWLAKRFGQAN